MMPTSLKQLFLLALLISLTLVKANAQIVVEPLRYNEEQARKAAGRNSSIGLFGINAVTPLSLPFFDDFTGPAYKNKISPDSTLWVQGEGTFINNRFPVASPSLNVATFDGLNESGTPYNFTKGDKQGPVDRLTSQPINLEGLDPSGADSVYLSFYWQAGSGKIIQLAPNDKDDSLMLQYKTRDTTENWVSVWKVSQQNSKSFKQENILVPAQFYSNNFKFRFISYGQQTDNVDMWHVDYVYMNKGRTKGDTLFANRSEFAISSHPSRLLKNYSAMPFNQFEASGGDELNDSVSTYVNLLGTSRVLRYEGVVKEVTRNELIKFYDGDNLQNGPLGGRTPRDYESQIKVNLPVEKDLLKQKINSPSRIEYQFNIRTEAGTPQQLNNDTASIITDFTDYYAYDDGTPELTFYSSGSYTQIAVKYNLNKPDTLTSIRIHLPKSENNIQGQPFTLIVWKNLLTKDQKKDSVIVLYRQSVAVNYSDELYGFREYLLDTTNFVISDTFFVGFLQTTGGNKAINIGMDSNSPTSNTIFVNSAGSWQQFNRIAGALMIRPVFGQTPLGIVKGKVKQSLDATIYPNPANDRIYIEGEAEEVIIYDLAGRLILTQKYRRHEQKELDISTFKPGMYLVHLSDKQKRNTIKKLIVNK